jgi:sigma-B regulation protein RsbU (phosphoserine phosphatase)
MPMTDARCILLLGLTDSAYVQDHFLHAGHQVTAAPWPDPATESLDIPGLDAVYLQPSDDGRAMEELKQILDRRPEAAVVLVCARPSLDLAIQSWRNGAADILFTPLTPEALDDSLRRIRRLASDKLRARDEPAAARFRYLDETGKECWVPIAPPKFTIGRSSTNDLVLGTAHISRAQAEILAKEGEYYLHDLKSKHGTFVNGIRIEQAMLRHGDRVRLGGMQGQILTFHRGDLLQSLLSSSASGTDPGLSVHGFREMAMLLSTFRALSSIPLLKDLLNLVVDTAIELTGAERGFIMLKEEDGRLSFRCARNAQKQSLDGASFQTSQRVPHEVFQTGERIVIKDLDLEVSPESHTSTRRLGVRSISCVPLRCLSLHEAGTLSGVGNFEVIGVLYVDSANIGGGLSTTQIDALDTLASEAAMAIYNARLYKESQLKQKLEEELAIAREIQQSLLPPPDKILPFVSARSLNLPCREVGGDYFDYFDMSGDRLGFAVGDVAGKGMPAALLAAMLQGIFCAQTLLNLPLPGMISNINCSLARRSTGSRFVTFFFGILDAEGNCTYINAGHNPPLWVRPDGTLHELTEGGMVLGLFPGASYESNTIRLTAGDHLVLFTDGVLEALNLAGEEFGEPRLRDLLGKLALKTAPEILDILHRELASFSAQAPQHDDITIMVLGFREATQPL